MLFYLWMFLLFIKNNQYFVFIITDFLLYKKNSGSCFNFLKNPIINYYKWKYKILVSFYSNLKIDLISFEIKGNLNKKLAKYWLLYNVTLNSLWAKNMSPGGEEEENQVEKSELNQINKNDINSRIQIRIEFTEFDPSLNPGINIIFIYLIQLRFFYLVFFFLSSRRHILCS